MPSDPPECGEGATETAQGDDASAVEDAGDDLSTPKATISFISGAKSRRHRAVAWTRTHSWRFVRWFVFLFIASLFIPALTKQWNDRRQELQVKEALLTDFSKASADAVYGAVEASFHEGKRQRAMRGALIGKWERDRAALDPRFEVYFDRSEAATHWFGRGRLAYAKNGYPVTLGYRATLKRYVDLACCDRRWRGFRVALLWDYLLKEAPKTLRKLGERWLTLLCGPQEGCQVDPGYRNTYRMLGDRLMDQRRVMLEQVLGANGEGFSSGWGDFIADLKPVR